MTITYDFSSLDPGTKLDEIVGLTLRMGASGDLVVNNADPGPRRVQKNNTAPRDTIVITEGSNDSNAQSSETTLHWLGRRGGPFVYGTIETIDVSGIPTEVFSGYVLMLGNAGTPQQVELCRIVKRKEDGSYVTTQGGGLYILASFDAPEGAAARLDVKIVDETPELSVSIEGVAQTPYSDGDPKKLTGGYRGLVALHETGHNPIFGSYYAANDATSIAFSDATLTDELNLPVAGVFEKQPLGKLIGKINHTPGALLSIVGPHAEFLGVVDYRDSRWLAHASPLLALSTNTVNIGIRQTDPNGIAAPHDTTFSFPVIAAPGKPTNSNDPLARITTQAFLRRAATLAVVNTEEWFCPEVEPAADHIRYASSPAELAAAINAIMPDGQHWAIRLRESAAWTGDPVPYPGKDYSGPGGTGSCVIEPDIGHDPQLQSTFRFHASRHLEIRGNWFALENYDLHAPRNTFLLLNSESGIRSIVKWKNNRFGVLWNDGRSDSDYGLFPSAIHAQSAEQVIFEGNTYNGVEFCHEVYNVRLLVSRRNRFWKNINDCHVYSPYGANIATYLDQTGFYADDAMYVWATGNHCHNVWSAFPISHYETSREVRHCDFAQIHDGPQRKPGQALRWLHQVFEENMVQVKTAPTDYKDVADGRIAKVIPFFVASAHANKQPGTGDGSDNAADRPSTMVMINNLTASGASGAATAYNTTDWYCEHNTFTGPADIYPSDGNVDAGGRTTIYAILTAGAALIRAFKNIVGVIGVNVFDENNKLVDYHSGIGPGSGAAYNHPNISVVLRGDYVAWETNVDDTTVYPDFDDGPHLSSALFRERMIRQLGTEDNEYGYVAHAFFPWLRTPALELSHIGL